MAQRNAPRRGRRAAASAATTGSNQERVLAVFAGSRGNRATIEQVTNKTRLTERQVRATLDRLRASDHKVERVEALTFKVS